MIKNCKNIALMFILILTALLFSACSASEKPAETQPEADSAGSDGLEIVESGFFAENEYKFTYYAIIENKSDRPVKDCTLVTRGYDENGEEIHMNGYEGLSFSDKRLEGMHPIGYIAPGGKTLASFYVNTRQKYEDFDAIPSSMEFEIKSVKWSKEDTEGRLEIVSFEEGEAYPDTIRTEDLSIVLKNKTGRDFGPYEGTGYDVYAVLRDAEGNICGIRFVMLSVDEDDSFSTQMLSPGEEKCFNTSYFYWLPHDSIEFYITYEDGITVDE
ncbi:MAG: hypothetical protein IJH91_04810 [Mogibacterium sp.]|nr:hypothetical protein [Mogibacterium sp.]